MVDNTLATEILMTQVILDYKSVLWEISVRINKCVYEILSKWPCVGIIN